jgi:hypothetical protein
VSATNETTTQFCYIADTATSTCRLVSGVAALTECTEADLGTVYSEAHPCCSRLAQLGVERKDMTGPCSNTDAATAVKCYTPNTATGTCDVVEGADACAALWAKQPTSISANSSSVFDSQQLCCGAVAAAVGAAKTSGSCSLALVTVNTTKTVDHFRSGSVFDDLALAATWLFKATGDVNYLAAAQRHLQEHFDREVADRLVAEPGYYAPGWDNSGWAAMALLLELRGSLPLAPSYRRMLNELFRTWKDNKPPRVRPGACLLLLASC